MTVTSTSGVAASDEVEVVLAVCDLDAELRFFTERAGFGIDAVFPADDPTTAIVSAGGVRLRLTRASWSCAMEDRRFSSFVFPHRGSRQT